MAKRTSDPEFDEFDKLLCEIPSVTSVTSNSEEPGVINLPKDLKNVSFDDSDKKLPTSARILNEGNSSVYKAQQLSIKRVQMDRYLSDDQSLASAFDDLMSFKDGLTMGSAATPFDNPMPSRNPFVLLDGHSPSSIIPSPQLPNNAPSGFDMNAQEIMKQQLCYSQPVEGFSGVLPSPHGAQGFHMLSNVAIPAVEFPVIPNQQPLYFDGQSPLPYLHAQQ